MFNNLDPVLHSQLRLAVMSLLIAIKEADFNFIKDKTKATSGNLSIQINKLKNANYIHVEKTFKDNYSLTTCSITPKGIDAFEKYIVDLKSYIKLK